MTLNSLWMVGKISESPLCMFISLSLITTSFDHAVINLRTTFFDMTNTKYTERLAIRYASISMVGMTTSSQKILV